MTNRRIRANLVALLFGLLATVTESTSSANPALKDYHSHEQLTQKLVELSQSGQARLTAIGKSQGGRNLWALTVGSGTGPAIVVVGSVQGSHLAGGELCLRMAERMIQAAGRDESVRGMLSQYTFHFLPRPDPDTSEKSLVGPWRLPAGNDRRTDDDRDFEFGEDPPEDLDGDGWITTMRVADETGDLMPHPDDNRVLIAADPNKNERGKFRVYVEGRDTDSDGRWNEDGGDGVNIDRNFPFGFQPFEPHCGPNAASEPEARALADFLFDHPEVAMVFSIGPEENLVHSWKPNGDRERQRIKTTVLGADAAAFEFLSNEYKQQTSITEGPGSTNASGSFISWAYFHLGKWSIGARGWSVPKVDAAAVSAKPDEKAPNEKAPDEKKPSDEKRGAEDLNALRWLQREGLDGFAPWTRIDHPDFPDRQTEVGGFRPFYLLNPPAKELDGIADKHYQFLMRLPDWMPRIAIAETRVEVLGAQVVRITAKSINRGFLATMPEMASVNGQGYPLQIELTAPAGSTFIQGSPRQRVARLRGNGGNQETVWLVRIPESNETSMQIHLSAPAVGAATAEIKIQGS